MKHPRMREVTADNEGAIKFALTTLITALNGIEKVIPTMDADACPVEALKMWHGLAEQATGVLFTPEPVNGTTDHHPNGTKPEKPSVNGRKLQAALVNFEVGHSTNYKCEGCNRKIKGAGPMGAHKKKCEQFQALK